MHGLSPSRGESRVVRGQPGVQTRTAPASRAAVSKAAVRRRSSLASARSRACSFGTSGRPKGCSRVQTTGPPSGESRDANCRETENVEHGGEATITAYSPAAHRWRRRLYTESRRISWSPPPRKHGGCLKCPPRTRAAKEKRQCHPGGKMAPKTRGGLFAMSPPSPVRGRPCEHHVVVGVAARQMAIPVAASARQVVVVTLTWRRRPACVTRERQFHQNRHRRWSPLDAQAPTR
eukprot:1652737-Pleurochrysis_carterae.AAC.1